MGNEQDLKNETKRLERVTLDIEKLKVNYWSLWQELGEIRKEIEGLNRTKEEKMTTNEAGKEKTIEGISRMCKDQQEWNYGMVKWSNEIDALIARHKATLDLLAKPARTPIQKAEDLVGFYNKPEPAECGCLDKAKLLDRLKTYIRTDNEEITSALEEEDYSKAARYKTALGSNQKLERAIEAGRFDRAPCKPEPAPYPIGSGEVIGFSPSYRDDGEGCVKVRLDDGRIGMFRAMPREEWEHTCRCSTANLVELLRARACPSNGIYISDLDARETMTINHTKPTAVIVVRKEDRS